MNVRANQPDGAMLKGLADTVAVSQSTAADTPALKAASDAFAASVKELEAAVNKMREATEKSATFLPKPVGRPSTPPSPAGPVPVPYPNIQMAQRETKGAVVVAERALQKHAMTARKLDMVIDQQVRTLGAAADRDSTATKRGLIDAKSKGAATFQQYSFTVKHEGKAVARLTDIHSNHRR